MPRTGVSLLAFAVAAIPARSTRADDGVVSPSELCPIERDIAVQRICPPFGAWGAALEGPNMVIGIGFNVRHLPRAQARDGNVARTLGPITDADASDSSVTVTERFGVNIARPIQIGLEAEFGTTTSLEPGARSFGAGALAFIGAHGGSRYLKLGIEAAAGGRIVDTEPAIGASSRLVDEEAVVVEVRGRCDFWLTPWVTIGAVMGTSVLDRREWFAGMNLGFNSHSYSW